MSQNNNNIVVMGKHQQEIVSQLLRHLIELRGEIKTEFEETLNQHNKQKKAILVNDKTASASDVGGSAGGGQQCDSLGCVATEEAARALSSSVEETVRRLMERVDSLMEHTCNMIKLHTNQLLSSGQTTTQSDVGGPNHNKPSCTYNDDGYHRDVHHGSPPMVVAGASHDNHSNNEIVVSSVKKSDSVTVVVDSSSDDDDNPIIVTEPDSSHSPTCSCHSSSSSCSSSSSSTSSVLSCSGGCESESRNHDLKRTRTSTRVTGVSRPIAESDGDCRQQQRDAVRLHRRKLNSRNGDENSGSTTVGGDCPFFVSVRGRVFATSRSTLRDFETDTFFSSLLRFHGEQNEAHDGTTNHEQNNNTIFLDRDPDVFEVLLPWMANPKQTEICVSSMTPEFRKKFLEDIQFYNITSLMTSLGPLLLDQPPTEELSSSCVALDCDSNHQVDNKKKKKELVWAWTENERVTKVFNLPSPPVQIHESDPTTVTLKLPKDIFDKKTHCDSCYVRGTSLQEQGLQNFEGGLPISRWRVETPSGFPTTVLQVGICVGGHQTLLPTCSDEYHTVDTTFGNVSSTIMFNGPRVLIPSLCVKQRVSAIDFCFNHATNVLTCTFEQPTKTLTLPNPDGPTAKYIKEVESKMQNPPSQQQNNSSSHVCSISIPLFNTNRSPTTPIFPLICLSHYYYLRKSIEWFFPNDSDWNVIPKKDREKTLLKKIFASPTVVSLKPAKLHNIQ
eukprot:TRINITY_DN68084_c4_g1_i11.p1 TRINITY_DN68084_c4_g1~~TRINITY_DN68084_c4_g1_i11.p1  ORF type:complete len:727 (+),score=133.35 TRINITY_DN68084_c4_g1_i11:54-2234(+)